MTDAERRLAIARFVTRHWIAGYLRTFRVLSRRGDSSLGPALHALWLVLAALDGETNPRNLGINPEADEAFAKVAA